MSIEAKAHVTHVRITPMKVGIVADLIRGKDTKTAVAILKHTSKSASEPLLKLLNSAVANAENNLSLDVDNLVISQVLIGPGPTMKRIRPKDHGRAHRILKRTSHITIAVKEKE